MDLTQILAWIVGANTVISFATTAYTLLSARATKALKAIDELGHRISALGEERQKVGDATVGRFQLVENRLLKIEATLEHVPDRDQAHRLELALEKLSGKMETLEGRVTGRMDALDERIRPLAATTSRIQNLLVEQAGERGK